MFDFLAKRRLYLSILVILLALGATLIYQAQSDKTDTPILALLRKVAYPFISFSDFITNQSATLVNRYIYLVDLEQDNQELRAQLAKLQQENSRLLEISANYKRLSRFLNFKIANSDLKVFAQVTGRISDVYSETLIINRGSADGIRKNQGVITPQGVVGKITQVDSNLAQVQLITDIRSKIPALVQSTRDGGLLTGVSAGEVELRLLSHEAQLEAGQRIVASGLFGIFPKGFLVGTISKIHKTPFGLFQQAQIETAVDFSKIEEVFVVTLPSSGINVQTFSR